MPVVPSKDMISVSKYFKYVDCFGIIVSWILSYCTRDISIILWGHSEMTPSLFFLIPCHSGWSYDFVFEYSSVPFLLFITFLLKHIQVVDSRLILKWIPLNLSPNPFISCFVCILTNISNPEVILLWILRHKFHISSTQKDHSWHANVFLLEFLSIIVSTRSQGPMLLSHSSKPISFARPTPSLPNLIYY